MKKPPTSGVRKEIDRNYIHANAFRHEDGPNGWYAEYDFWGRIVFVRENGGKGYWSMRFYHKPEPPTWNPNGAPIVDTKPFEVIHKWWGLYHAERDTAVYEPEIEENL